jgi:ribonucleotide monophosphatase NagD (HAD superfamily)
MNRYSRAAMSESFKPKSSIIDIPVLLQGLKDISARYDIFLFDQFGVLHDGLNPYPAAVETIEQLAKFNRAIETNEPGAKRKKAIIILSNTSKRSSYVLKLLTRLGFNENLFTSVISSGELAWKFIFNNYSGGKCCWFSWDNYDKDDYMEGLNLTLTEPENSDFLLFHGSQRIIFGSGDKNNNSMTMHNLFDMGEIDENIVRRLEKAVSRGVPAICANMDYSAVTATGKKLMLICLYSFHF